MLGFIKQKAWRSGLEDAFAKVVATFCGEPLFAGLPSRNRRMIAERALDAGERIHGSRVHYNSDDVPVDDLMIIMFLLFASHMQPKVLEHHMIVIGLMEYIKNIDTELVSQTVLDEVSRYIEANRI